MLRRSRLPRRKRRSNFLPPYSQGFALERVQFHVGPNKKHPVWGAFYLVEPTGIEPVSESLSAQPSPWADDLLEFPCLCVGRQTHGRVALLCMIDTRAKSRFMFTTDLTHGGSRSPHPRYGRFYNRVTAYAARATLLLSFNFKGEQFYGIIQPATLIVPPNPRRNHCGPMSRKSSSYILYTKFSFCQ